MAGPGRARDPSVLAYGDVKRVELAIALAHRPRLLLMDEPTAGMAPRERNELMALARRLAHEQSIGVLFTEHSMDVVFAHADRIIVLARGELIAEGPPAAVRDSTPGCARSTSAAARPRRTGGAPMRHPVSTPIRFEEQLSGAVLGGVVGCAIGPGAPDHAQPSAGEDADGVGMVATACLALA